MNDNAIIIPLCVPLWDQTEALSAGALYSKERGFYADDSVFLDSVWHWLPRCHQVLQGTPVLLPDMLPSSTWEQNIRTVLGTDMWDRIRKHAYKASGFRCEICGEGGKLEAHEKFQLINETATQKLVKIMALCPLCHKVHHLGIARRLGMIHEVKAHLLRINRWTPRELESAIQEAYETWEQRSEWDWQLDLSWLYDQGYVYV